MQVTTLAALAVSAVLVISAVALVQVQQRSILGGIDDGLFQRADDLQSLIRAGTLPDVLADRDGDDALAQIVTVAGRVLAASPRARNAPPLVEPVAVATRVTTHTAVDNDPFRILSLPVEVDGEAAVIHVASSVENLDVSRRTLIGSLAVGVPMTVALLSGLVWLLVGRTLRPVAGIAAEVAAIGGGDLGRRVPQPPGDDEVGRLARLMNDMLARLEDSDVRQRRFVADASHELRSPLARIRSQVEVDQAHPETIDIDSTLGGIREDVTGMQDLLDDLLFLARRDAGQARPTHRPMDLSDVVAAALPGLGRPGIEVDTTKVRSTPVTGDARQISRVISNLLANAIRHAEHQVVVATHHGDAGVGITVADDGPGIPPADAERVFERFVRLDEARSAGDGGAGLGLGIARDIAQAHGGDISVARGEGPASSPGAVLILTIPGQGD